MEDKIIDEVGLFFESAVTDKDFAQSVADRCTKPSTVESPKITVEINSDSIPLYHGTSNSNFVPDVNYHNPNNDYGSGLYMTPNLQSAKEWAMSKYNEGTRGYAYEFEVSLSTLRVLDLTKMDSMYWLALLLKNRSVQDLKEIPFLNAQRLMSMFYLDLAPYDIIKGWRADDSYYTFAKDFVSGLISLETLEKAMSLGKLGIQYCLKTNKAFSALKCINVYTATKADGEMFNKRDKLARQQYRDLQRASTGRTTIYEVLGRYEEE